MLIDPACRLLGKQLKMVFVHPDISCVGEENRVFVHKSYRVQGNKFLPFILGNKCPNYSRLKI